VNDIILPSNDRAAWLEQRRSGIGGSDAPAILGVSRFATPLDVYFDKRGLVPDRPPNGAMEWGTRLEPLVRQAYAEATGRTVRVPTTILRHPTHAFMLGSIDGVTEDGRLVEIKTSRSAEGWGEPGSDEVPDAYLVQVQHYLTVTGLTLADVAVLIGGSDFRLYEVPADPDLQATLIDIEGAFWDRVQRGDPPDPVTYADAQKRWPTSSARIVQAPAEVFEAVQRLHAAKVRETEAEKEADALQAAICAAMGEGDVLVYGDATLATWKAGKAPLRFNTDAFKAAHPDLYAEFAKPGSASRRFLLR
jgi:putative phage-type endonuclease